MQTIPEIEVLSVPFEHKNLPEVRIKSAADIVKIAALSTGFVLVAKDVQANDSRFPGADVPVTKRHSFKAVIANGIFYKHIYDVKKEE